MRISLSEKSSDVGDAQWKCARAGWMACRVHGDRKADSPIKSAPEILVLGCICSSAGSQQGLVSTHSIKLFSFLRELLHFSRDREAGECCDQQTSGRQQGDTSLCGFSLAAHWGLSLSQPSRERPAGASCVSAEVSDMDNVCKYKSQTELLLHSLMSHADVPQAILQ